MNDNTEPFTMAPEVSAEEAVAERPLASVSVLQRSPLTPRQILAGTLHDKDFADIGCVVVITVLKKGGECVINYSDMASADLAYIRAKFDQHVLNKL